MVCCPADLQVDRFRRHGQVTYDLAEGEIENLVFGNSTQTSYSKTDYAIMDASNNCGGGGAFRQWWLTATDWVGNSTRKIIYGKVMRVTQENNTDGSLSNYAVKPTITYSGAWSTSTFAGYSLGKAQKTTAAGASATMTVAVPSGAVSHMGLVMGTGPQRGSFKLYVDGVLTKTISTYAAANRDRVIVWEKSMRAGTHRVKIVNVATAGHPGLYLDAVLTN